jgi:uncharacterized membrane protein
VFGLLRHAPRGDSDAGEHDEPNRQDTKDRLRGEFDFAVNRRDESEVQALSRKLNTITGKIDDLEDLVRRKVAT